MKKFILNISLFFIFASLFYLSALFILESKYSSGFFEPNVNYNLGSYGNTHTRLKEIDQVENLDILFLGSSHTYRGFDTRIFSKAGFNSFNLGTSSQTPIQTNVLLKRYLDQVQPQLIIYEVYPYTFSSDGVESSLDIISNDINDLYSFEMAIKTNHLTTYNTLFYASIRNIFQLNENYVESKQKNDDTYFTGGYVEKEISYYQPVKLPKKEIKPKKSQLISFDQTVNIIKENNIELILVYAPITKDLYSSYTDNKYFDSLMKTYGNYYNFNELMNLEDSLYFYDSHHLNQKGVQLFNKKLLKVIENNSKLKSEN